MAPPTGVMLKEFPAEPAHLLVGWIMPPGVGEIVVGVILPVVEAVLVPHVLVAVTDTVPAPVPMFITADRPELEATDHPVPLADHV